MKTILNSIEINPQQPAIGSVIWLHGLGADGNDFASVVDKFDLPLRFIFPNGPMQPVTINNGYVMRAWYDIYSLGLNQRIDEKGIDASVTLLENLIENEVHRGIETNNIILAGFSQGAVIALTTGLRYPKPLAGILALSGYLPNPEKAVLKSSLPSHTLPIFVGHGTEDTVVPYFLGEQIYHILEKNNYAVSLHSYPIAHSVSFDEIIDIKKWLQSIFNPANTKDR